MKISYNWLKQFLNLDWEVSKTAELLTDLGLEVGGIDDFESVKGGLEGVVVGHVLTCVKHPNADRLKLTTVDIGGDSPVQIVCGAPNVAVGQKVPVATVGTTLYNPEGEEWQIKKGKIRGEESHGMICAEDELGLGESHDGILVLDEKLVPGTPCSQVFAIENDKIIEIDLTPNRSDAMSHYGVARDLKAGLEQNKVDVELITPSTSNFSVDNRTLKLDVEVENSEKAPRYCGVTIDGIKVGPSPDWMQHRLKAIGLSPINNVVDATNYVLHDLGQPLHAFDAHKIKGGKVEVRTLPQGTKFITLDGVERELHQDDLMICDIEKPMCIAGVFGGIHSGVTEETSAIFLESAYFDPITVRKTAKRHGLNTDASFRFERGIDINFTEYALKVAANLIKEVAGGQISSEIVDLYPTKKEDLQVVVTFERINSLVGQEIPRETVKSILTSLEIKINNVTETGLGLTIPSYRTDVVREVDVIEEILRVYGYNNVESKEKFTTSISKTEKVENHILQNIISDVLVSRGFFEIMTNSLSSNSKNETNSVEMLNPLSADLAVLRTSMIKSGLDTILHNSNRKQADLKLFEFGKTYSVVENKYLESQQLALFITGNINAESWLEPSRTSNFFYLKGMVNAIISKLGLGRLSEEPSLSDIFSEGLQLSLDKKIIVELGLLSKNLIKEGQLKADVFYAKFNWDAILELLNRSNTVFSQLSKFPEVKRDFSLLLDDNISYARLKETAFNAERSLLKEINLFDVYTGDKLPKGKKSYAVSFTLLDEKRTLTEKNIDKTMQKLQRAFEKELKAELR
ncbi:phenylalanine--tRNA ligase subunit beta [Croceivirga thetidis]|uniref:Phenylalanine--tRNA ligase beta subunit n=1 Tax=Croceivirga thetidis TaxID=2721623 RepID=A0ABX1GRE2_9FLAO|nr:phenylalanine--tRNA ligase subunit beta [Croceivirga thetidis]NKI32518.1 phenylalanine--tRNA ligase subunit beta [Croceivirga thetidis]